MAFGIRRKELMNWKESVKRGEIAILTHYWEDERFPASTSVTKVGCINLDQLSKWGEKYQLKPEWIHRSSYPHFDVFGKKQKEILQKEGLQEQINRFNI